MSEPILSREQIRAYDAVASERCSVPSLVLMENAGRGAAEIIARMGTLGPVVILCGTGNNGGDGFVVARHLLARGIHAEVVLLGAPDKVRGDAQLNLDALVGLEGQVIVADDDDITDLQHCLETAALTVDAIFGTGLSRPIEGRYRAAIEALNEFCGESDCPCVALDIPSGIDADTGEVLGVAVLATTTITFGRYKAGLFQGAGVTHRGKLELVGLGVPDGIILDEVGQEAALFDADLLAAALGPRAADAHKYSAGSVLVVAGSAGKLGAALLVARGVLRAGAGLATIATWPDAADALGGRVEEAMTLALDPGDLLASLAEAYERRTAVAVGPGLGTDERARVLAETVALGFEGPAVLDADAITCFADRPEALRGAVGPRVLTPHAGELARLLGRSSAEVQAHRFAAAREAASRTGCTVVLKGPHTVVATEGTLDVCLQGNPALATAGSGDVLTGITAAMLCSLPPHDAACAAVLLHARAADGWRDRTKADRGMLAGEIADEVPAALASLLAG